MRYPKRWRKAAAICCQAKTTSKYFTQRPLRFNASSRRRRNRAPRPRHTSSCFLPPPHTCTSAEHMPSPGLLEKHKHRFDYNSKDAGEQAKFGQELAQFIGLTRSGTPASFVWWSHNFTCSLCGHRRGVLPESVMLNNEKLSWSSDCVYTDILHRSRKDLPGGSVRLMHPDRRRVNLWNTPEWMCELVSCRSAGRVNPVCRQNELRSAPSPCSCRKRDMTYWIEERLRLLAANASMKKLALLAF